MKASSDACARSVFPNRTLPVLAAACLAVLGCSPWHAPTDEQRSIASLAHRGIRGPAARLRIQLDVESPWLSGQFTGVVLAKPDPAVRVQLFPDLGGKVVDLLATPKRVVGYFPHLREGLDCRLPEEARPHPLLFMGLHLLELAAPLDEKRVTGWRSAHGPAGVVKGEARASSVVEGATLQVAVEASVGSPPTARTTGRRFRWIYGVEWVERPDGEDTVVIEAPRVRIRVKIVEAQELKDVPKAFELELPSDVRRTDR